MEVFSKYFRRLLTQNASQIFGGASNGATTAGTYDLLVSEVQKVRQEPEQAKKIAESLDTPEGEVFKDFDVSTFMERCKLDSVSKCMLALALKSASKSDLKTKGLSNKMAAVSVSLEQFC
jgi:CCR4-NOT transcription complex subunit 1